MTPKIHMFEDTGEAYDSSQCWDEIKDGDILSVPNERAVAVLIEAWPVAISENAGNFHAPSELLDWAKIPTTESGWKETKNYSESFEMAVNELNRISIEAAQSK